MKAIVSTLVLAAALPLAAQQAAAPAKPQSPIVATINSEVITAERLDALYDAMNTQMRRQYDENGGKSAYLDNYMKKRLLIQEAIKQGFDRRPDVQLALEAARESALFDRYVREVVAGQIVTDFMLRQYYTENEAEFHRPLQVKARHIIVAFGGPVGPQSRTKEEAIERLSKVRQTIQSDIAAANPKTPEEKMNAAIRAFDKSARVFGEDGTVKQGGDLGWFPEGRMHATFDKVVFGIEPGVVSEPFESPFGIHLVLVEGKRPEGPAPFEEVLPQIRETLLAKHSADVMQQVGRMTTQLRQVGNVSVFPENVK